MYNLEDVEKKILELVKKQFGREVEFDKIESIRFVELMVRIEDEFDIEIEDEDLDINILSDYKTLADYVYKKLA